MIVVELWGGPQDGLHLALPELRQGISFPVAPDLRAEVEDIDTPFITKELIYLATGRMRAGCYLFKYAGTQDH